MTTKLAEPDRRTKIIGKFLLGGMVFMLALIVSIIVADLLPPPLEQIVTQLLACALLVFVLAATAIPTWGLTRYLIREATAQHVWCGLALVVGTVALCIGISLFQGVRMGLSIAALPWAVLFPLAMLLISPVNHSSFGAAWRGAVIAGIAALCYFCVYCLLVGSERAYMVGGVGPGVLSFIGDAEVLGLNLLLFFISVWGPTCLFGAGALGGILGEKLRRITRRRSGAIEKP